MANSSTPRKTERRGIHLKAADVHDTPAPETAQEHASAPAKSPPPDLSTVDPFDPSRFRRNTLAAHVGAQGTMTRCPLVKNPNPDQFVRASTDPEFCDFPCAILDLPTQREEYLLTPDVADAIAADLPKLVKDQALTLGIDRQGNPFLWRYTPAFAPSGDNEWNASKRHCIAMAQQGWVRIENKGGHYGADQIRIEIPDPVWPKVTMREVIKLAFGDRFITDVSHPVVQRLLGRAA